ncbi:MAG: hypothetical protein M1823_000886 [Watsoniomyces obsoletus]|nr:MAG: hypothetical protein M1823_000886 [Watsoniomyces obsoletus]
MPSINLDPELAEAVLSFVRHGTYPESEDVISAEFSSSAILPTLKLLQDARQDIQVKLPMSVWPGVPAHVFIQAHIRSKGGDGLPEVEQWISEATRLNEDIQESEAASQDIARLEEEWRQLGEQAYDVASKYDLLRGEIAFNEALVNNLERLLKLKQDLDFVEETLVSEDAHSTAISLIKVEASIASVHDLEGTAVIGLLRARSTELRKAFIEGLEKLWNDLIRFDHMGKRLHIERSVAELASLIEALDKLGLLPTKMDSFVQDLSKLLNAVIDMRPGVPGATVTVDGNAVQLREENQSTNLKQCLNDLTLTIEQLNRCLPRTLKRPLSQRLLPLLSTLLISRRLSPAVPVSLEGSQEFERLTQDVTFFRDGVRAMDWEGDSDLNDWLENIPQVWLSRRRETCLEAVRNILLRGPGSLRRVERAETERVSADEGAVIVNGQHGSIPGPSKTKEGSSASGRNATDDSDMSAWGFDAAADQKEENAPDEIQDAEEAWGITQESEEEEVGASEENGDAANTVQMKSDSEPQKSLSTREMTLKEIYGISSGPGAILEILGKLLYDAVELRCKPGSGFASIAPAADGLLPIAALVLAMYRALSSYYYSKHPSGRMLLYNDSFWLGDQLRILPSRQLSSEQLLTAKDKANLESNSVELETFGKVAYKKEMETQRRRLTDLLEPAKGFENCTTEPFAERCEDAIDGIVNTVRDLDCRWSDVLSRSALLQSLGSLISHVISAIILDIEDMSDISELESQQLTKLCGKISGLEDLFMPEGGTHSSHPSQADPLPLTAIYTPNWFRFQFLVNILESSLADIRYLWTEGELKLEFTADEVVDLIEALFTDSEQRRRTIVDIKRGSTMSG